MTFACAPVGRRALLAAGPALLGSMALGPVVLGGAGGCAGTARHAAAAGGRDPRERLSAAQAWARLAAGNRLWAAGRPRRPDADAARRRQVAAGQAPLATVVACIDSRVAPEVVFDQGLGDVFAVRTGAQTLDGLVAGSVAFGPLEGGTPLVVVLGHQRCGAVTAAVAALEAGRRPPGGLADVVGALRPAYYEARRAGAGDLVERTVRAQVVRTARAVAGDRLLAARVRAGTLGVVGAYYSLDSGWVSVLSTAGPVGVAV
ncbi:carbonic anhydrase [Actinomadura parmotrematis]|uniref:Carbonic anhydrase n=1 Tax=Actinomadura parmotrematis TaxID=2864039 RepID=A0ABS7FSL7_9ACTN|nr:carbonic anhydrase [Actinomadura parmotrematis]MBW8482562.1 carbonic anhydrase [Actinomadura parmotrematis]